jgi:hypothetical protein
MRRGEFPPLLSGPQTRRTAYGIARLGRSRLALALMPRSPLHISIAFMPASVSIRRRGLPPRVASGCRSQLDWTSVAGLLDGTALYWGHHQPVVVDFGGESAVLAWSLSACFLSCTRYWLSPQNMLVRKWVYSICEGRDVDGGGVCQFGWDEACWRVCMRYVYGHTTCLSFSPFCAVVDSAGSVVAIWATSCSCGCGIRVRLVWVWVFSVRCAVLYVLLPFSRLLK